MSTVVDFPSQGTIGANLQPKRFDIVIYQGDTFKFNLALKSGITPVDVTGWTARVAILKSGNTPGETPEMTVLVGDVDGKITISLTGTETAALLNNTEYIYDVEIEDTDENIRTLIGGTIIVTEDITE